MKVFTAFTSKLDGNMKSVTNQIEFLKKHGLQDKSPIIMKQIHGNKVCIVDGGYTTTECDSIISTRKDVVLFVLVADCQPILMFDENKGVIATIHAGREGVFANIVPKTVEVFLSKFNSNIEDIRVIIGPSAQKCCYEVGAVSNKYIDYVQQNFGEKFVYGKNIDLQGITIKQILKQGILLENITPSDVCTMESDKYFSYRNGNNGNKHRFAGVIGFK